MVSHHSQTDDFLEYLWTNWLNRILSICTQFICLMVDSGFALSNIVLRKKSRAYYRTFMHTWNALNVDCNFASDWFKEWHEFPWTMTRHYRAKTINQRLTIYKKITFAGQKKITLRFFRQGLCTWSKLLAGKKCFWHVLNGTEKRLSSDEYSSLTVWGGNKNLFEKKTVFAKPAWRYALVTQPNVFSIALLLILTMVGSTVTRANTIMIFPNLFTFTPLLRSVIQISIGATLNTPAKFVIAISKIAREKLPPASKDWKKKKGKTRYSEREKYFACSYEPKTSQDEFFFLFI